MNVYENLPGFLQLVLPVLLVGFGLMAWRAGSGDDARKGRSLAFKALALYLWVGAIAAAAALFDGGSG